MNRAEKIIRANQCQINKYQRFKTMALAEGDIKYAQQCQEQIDKLNKGNERWRAKA